MRKDRKIIERIYIFPKKEVENRKSISIYNNDNYHWYEKYRFTDEKEIKRVNDIWKKIIDKTK